MADDTQEKLDELLKLFHKMDKRQARHEMRMETLAKDCEALKGDVWGNGKDGMKTHVDRLIQRDKSRTWQFRAVSTAILGLAAKVFFDLFTGGKGT